MPNFGRLSPRRLKELSYQKKCVHLLSPIIAAVDSRISIV